MIIEYHRPETIEEALSLIARKEPITLPMGGGTVLNQPSSDEFAVVDLQDLGLNKIHRHGHVLHIGGTSKLQNILVHPDVHIGVKNSLRHEATNNLRQMRSIAGTVVAADGRSPIVTSLLALDAQMMFAPGDEIVSLGNFLPMRSTSVSHRLIISLSIPLNTKVSYQYVARSPADLPIVCVAVAQWSSGRTRLALGGYGDAPVLALDGPGADGFDQAAAYSFSHAGDQWASAEYRGEVAVILASRCIDELASMNIPQ